MTDPSDNEEQQIRREIISVLLRSDTDATCGVRPVEEVAGEWIDAGFDDPEEIEDWIRARCFKAAGARTLDDAGITPVQAALRTKLGVRNDEDTLGFKLITGDLSFDEARRIITNEFWNT